MEGTGSDIHLDGKELEWSQIALGMEDYIAMFTCSFFTASTMLHELAHAAVFAAHASSGGNAFFGDSVWNEAGFEMVNYLFNAQFFLMPSVNVQEPEYTLNGQDSWLNGMIAFLDLPNATHVKGYQTTGNCSFRTGEDFGPAAYAVWNVSFLHVDKFFRKPFWSSVNSVEDLRPVRMTGKMRYCAPEERDLVKVESRRLLPWWCYLTSEDDILRKGD